MQRTCRVWIRSVECCPVRKGVVTVVLKSSHPGKTYRKTLFTHSTEMKSKYLTLLLSTLCAGAASAQTVVDSFEYATTDDLLASWSCSGNTTLSMTNDVAATVTGTQSMVAQFNFPSTAYATEVITGPELSAPISIASTQYLTFRVKGDPAFKSADFCNLYLYAWDTDGNFGRWGATVPKVAEWKVFSFVASSIEKPWDSTQLPDLSRISKFAFYQYGSATAISEYSAAIEIDELTVRDTLLYEAPTDQETVVENFEYATPEELTTNWTAEANATISGSGSVATQSLGTNALKVEFTFPSMEWSAVKVLGPVLTTSVPIGPKQYISLRIKGDPAFAAADFRTFFLYVYDASGNFGRWGASIPTNSDWQILNFSAADIAKPWDSPGLPDLSAIVRFGIIQYGSQAVLPEYTATIYVDDIMVRNTMLADATNIVERNVETFEYASTDVLVTNWVSGTETTVSLVSDVSKYSTGKTSMQMQFNFPSSEWVAEHILGPSLTNNEVVISPKQYVAFRVKGDPAFSTADFQELFLYAYDTDGNFGRWGAVVPLTNDWTVFNFLASTIEKPWDSPALPNLSHIVRFKFVQYGSQAAIDAYSATICVDDIMIRNAQVVDAEAPAITVSGTAPNGLTGATITGIVLDEANKMVTADLPTTGQGFLTIKPAQQIKSVTKENGKLVIRW